MSCVGCVVNRVGTVEKRDGRIEVFDVGKISGAVEKAVYAYCGDSQDYSGFIEDVTNEVVASIGRQNVVEPTVEEIQDTVEDVLRNFGRSDISDAYHNYRVERTLQRERNSEIFNLYKEITFSSAADSDVKRENANVNSDSPMGTMLKYGSEGAKHYYLTELINQRFADAHRNGEIHIHDLDFYPTTTTCCQIDLTKLLDNGFHTGHGAISPPQTVESRASLLCVAIQSNQNDQHGGQSIGTFDYMMAPGVHKSFCRHYFSNLRKLLGFVCDDTEGVERVISELQFCNVEDARLSMSNAKNYQEVEKGLLVGLLGLPEEAATKIQKNCLDSTMKETEKSCAQAAQIVLFNLNSMHSRCGAQVPFSSINYGTDTSPEGRMITKHILLATEKGLGHNECPIFPVQIMRLKDGINTKAGDPNYDLFQLACRVSAKRLFPNFSFQDATYNLQYYDPERPETEVAYMGCRTRVIANVYDPSRAITNGRGNLSFTSINLPRIAYLAKGNWDVFYEELARVLCIVRDQLLERLSFQKKRKAKCFQMLMGNHVWLDSEKLNPEDEVGDVLNHGTLGVGFIGLSECLTAMIGCDHSESEEAQSKGLEIIQRMRTFCDEQSQAHKLNFTLLATPAEGLCGRFCRIDAKKYPEHHDLTDKGYYTNSFHVPVDKHITMKDKIDIEAPYHALTNAGHITYIECDSDLTQNLMAFERLVLYAKEKNLGYFAINHPVDYDERCGYVGIINDECPGCGRDTQDGKDIVRIRRVTGYLTGGVSDTWNDAKQKELVKREKHALSQKEITKSKEYEETRQQAINHYVKEFERMGMPVPPVPENYNSEEYGRKLKQDYYKLLEEMRQKRQIPWPHDTNHQTRNVSYSSSTGMTPEEVKKHGFSTGTGLPYSPKTA